MASRSRVGTRRARMPTLEEAPMKLEVDCYSGYRGDETPRRLVIDGTSIEVRVVERWRTPEHRYFRLHGEDGGTYVIRQGESGDWEWG